MREGEIRTHRCPACDAPLKFRDMREIPTFPFCSERCRMADLGRWLNEEYRIPSEGTFDVMEEEKSS